MKRMRTIAVILLCLASSADLTGAPGGPFPARQAAYTPGPAARSARLHPGASFQMLMDELFRRTAPWRRYWPGPRVGPRLA